MAMRAPTQRRQQEPTIALINIVFLMLVFFLVAGTITPVRDGRVDLVETQGLVGSQPADAVVITPDGTMQVGGAEVDAQTALSVATQTEGITTLRLVPDRNLRAADLMRISGQFVSLGVQNIVVVTERGTSR